MTIYLTSWHVYLLLGYSPNATNKKYKKNLIRTNSQAYNKSKVNNVV